MSTITAFEAKTKFGELLDRVLAGEEIVITRHDKPIARIIPEGLKSLDEVRRAGEGLLALQHEIARTMPPSKFTTWEDFKPLMEEGRK